MQQKPVTVAVAGFGLRARDYTQYAVAHPERMRVVAIGEIDEKRRRDAAAKFDLPADRVFDTAEALLAQPKLADAMFITTQDRQHVEMALAALEKGYELLVEKPISPSLADCLRLRDAAHRAGKSVTVCHVLRYTHFYQTVKQAIDSGVIGEVVSIQATENVGYFHQAHSFVRGNWRDSGETSPMILAKCCHDLDLLVWLMDKPCTDVASFGGLHYFKPECAPQGAAKRCLDGCAAKAVCPYDAEKIYIHNNPTGVIGGTWKWPVNAVAPEHTAESVYQALREGPYGRCVFHCDNNVVDHQTVIARFEGGTTASLTMCGFTNHNSRQIKVMGTLGDIVGDLETNTIAVQPFGQPAQVTDIAAVYGVTDGHAGGDARLIESLMDSLSGTGGAAMLSAIDRSVESHVMALAAEHSRLHNGCGVNLARFEAECLGGVAL